MDSSFISDYKLINEFEKIAEKNNISLEDLYKFNPDLDPQTMAPGQKIRLSE